MKVIFAKDRKITSLIIRLFTWSRYHHCGALTADGKHVIESTALHGGVIKTPIDEFKARYNKTVTAELICDDEAAQSFLEAQIGKKYDWLAILSIVLRFKFQNKNKWFCFELVAAASGLFRAERGARVTGSHLWAISKDLD